MFILDADRIPATSAELSAAISLSLAKWIQLPADAAPVKCSGSLPNLSALSVDLSRGQIASTNSLPFEAGSGKLQAGPTVRTFSIVGHPISLAGTPVQLDLGATQAVFAYAGTPGKKLIATLREASNGRLSIQLLHADLEAGALRLARQFAGDSVAIQKLEISLTSNGPTELDVLLTITAKKFVTAIVRVAGKVAIDDQIVATLSGLKASAEGMVGTIAVNLLQPHLQKLEGKPLPLMAFSLGNVKLHDVEIHTTDGLQISAAFGSGSV